MKRLFAIPDCHHPYVDRRAWRVTLNAIRHVAPDVLLILGDFGDFYATSRHLKDPNRNRDLKKEIDACNHALDEVAVALRDNAQLCERHFIMGNHEVRLEDYLKERAPELYNLVSVEALFLLKERGYKITPYADFVRIGKLAVSHDFEFAGPNAHVQSANATWTNTLIGHTHRLATSYSGTVMGKHHVACMAGWLGDARRIDYKHKAKVRKDWMHGFVIGHILPSGVTHLTPVPIIDGRCVIDGMVVEA